MKVKALLSRVASFLPFAQCVLAQAGGSSLSGMDETIAIQREGLQRMRDFLGPEVPRSLEKRAESAAAATINFSNPAAQQFFVDGTTIPDGDERYCSPA